MRKIIIPAAGKATRFNGILKEFASINNEGLTALENTIQTSIYKLGATHITIISNPEKREVHTEFVKSIMPKYKDTLFYMVPQMGNRDLLSAITTGLITPPFAVEGGLLMPDTIVDLDPVEKIQPGITFGVFATNEPERFSIIDNGGILTKPKDIAPGWYAAWGIVLWSLFVGSHMREANQNYTHYDEMFDTMMYLYGHHTFALRSYYDIGSIEHYMKYMDETL